MNERKNSNLQTRLIFAAVVVMAMIALQGLCLSALEASAVYDTFTRADSTDLGTTEDPNQYPWLLGQGDGMGEAGPEALASIDNQSLLLGEGQVRSGVSVGTGSAWADVDFSVDMSITGGSWGGVVYRQENPGNMWNSYLVYFPPDGTNVQMFLNGGIGGAVIDVDWAVPHTVRVRAVGDKHEVWIDGTQYIDITNAGKLTGGYVGLIRDTSEARFDNLNIVPEPASMIAVLMGLFGLTGAMRRRH